jgi:hypothetical protein
MAKFIISAVALKPGGGSMTISAEDGRKVEINLYGDCCSQTFFDDDAKMDVAECLGHELVSIEEAGEMDNRVKYEHTDQESYYSLHIKTDRASFQIPFRNDSNGYYGGSAEWNRDWATS